MIQHNELNIDPKGARRQAITNDGGVWDILPLKVARGHAFIKYPHLSIALRESQAVVATTVPNGISGGFRTRLRDAGIEGFMDLMQEIEELLRPVITQSIRSRFVFYATQRHYKSQRSKPVVDGRIEADLRTCVQDSHSDIKYQPEWIESIYNVLIHKSSNIQCGIEVQFDYACPIVRSPKAIDLFANSWKALRPFLDFVLDDN